MSKKDKIICIVIFLAIFPILGYGQLNVSTNTFNLTATSASILASFSNGSTGFYADNIELQYGESSGNYSSGTISGSPTYVSSVNGSSFFGLNSLSPSTTYYYVVNYTYQGTPYTSTESVFTTNDPEPANVITDSATNISLSGLTLNATLIVGSILPLDQVAFEWGTTTSYGSQAYATPQETASNCLAEYYLDGSTLSQGITYHYRIKARDRSLGSYQTIYGEDRTFILSEAPVALDPADLAPYSFRAQWKSFANAAAYLLDVSTKVDFSSFVDEYHGLEITSPDTNQSVNGNLSPGTNYFYRIRAKLETSNNTTTYSNTISLTTPTSTQWIGSNSEEWHNSNNWEFATVPDSALKAIIPADSKTNWPILSSDARIAELELGLGAQIKITNGATLSVDQNGLVIPQNSVVILDNGNLTISQGNIHIESGSSGSGSIVIKDLSSQLSLLDGSSSIERYVSGNTWHAISSPVSDELAGQFFFGHNPVVYFLEYNEASSWDGGTTPCEDCWSYIEDITTPLTSMQGYFYWIDAASETIEFTGNYHNQDISFNLTDRNPASDNDGSGWNFIGNPYPSSFDWSSATIPADCDDAIYFWQPGGGADGDYKSWVNGSGGTESAIIPTAQGFYVHATANNTNLTLSNNGRTYSTKDFYKTHQEKNSNELKISMGNGIEDEMFVRILADASVNFDKQYDAYKLFGTGDIPQIYTRTNRDELLEIQSLPLNDSILEVPLSIQVTQSKNYSIKFAGIEDFDEEITIFLRHNESGNICNLREFSQVDTYLQEGINEAVYTLIFNKNSASAYRLGEEDYLVYSQGKQIIIKRLNTSYPSETFAIYDLPGRLIKKGNLPAGQVEIDMQGNTRGLYIIKLENLEGVHSKKIYLK